MGKGRAPCCDKSKVKRGPWSPQEDLKLISFIQKHGHLNWRSLPSQAGLLRCGKSCRLRWINYLRPDVKRGNFTKEEEETIMKLHETFGNKWSKIASKLPGRTDNEIKNVWHTHLKKKLLKKSTITDGDHHQSKQESSSCITSSSSSSSSTGHQPATTTLIPQTDNIKNQDQRFTTDHSSLTPLCKLQEDHHQLGLVAAGSSLMGPEDDSNNNTVVLNEVVDKPANNSGFLEIPLEADDDFWNMLDDDNIGADGGGSLVSNNDHHQIHHSDVENMKYWIREIEKDLGLEPQASSSDDLTIGLSGIDTWPNNGAGF